MATNLDGVRIYDNHCEVSMSDRSASHVSVSTLFSRIDKNTT